MISSQQCLGYAGSHKGVDSVGARGALAPPLFGRAYLVSAKLIVEWTDFQCHVSVNGQKTLMPLSLMSDKA